MVGYGDASDAGGAKELLNGQASLLKLLHPNDVLPTVTAFTAHIHDRSGRRRCLRSSGWVPCDQWQTSPIANVG